MANWKSFIPPIVFILIGGFLKPPLSGHLVWHWTMSKVNVLWQCKISVLDVTLNNCLVTGWPGRVWRWHRATLVEGRVKVLTTTTQAADQFSSQNGSYKLSHHLSFSWPGRILVSLLNINLSQLYPVCLPSEVRRKVCARRFITNQGLRHYCTAPIHCTIAPMHQCSVHQSPRSKCPGAQPVVVQWCAATSNTDAQTNMLMCILVAVLRCKLIPESRISLECTGGCHLDRLTPLMFDWLCGTTTLQITNSNGNTDWSMCHCAPISEGVVQKSK